MLVSHVYAFFIRNSIGHKIWIHLLIKINNVTIITKAFLNRQSRLYELIDVNIFYLCTCKELDYYI